MAEVLIIDTCKSSIVMTSEIFKDKLPGTLVTIASNGAQALEKLPLKAFDMVVVDFDLPDTDGVTLTKMLRKEFAGPILITAFPQTIVDTAIANDLFAYADSSSWVKKPIRFEDLSVKIDRFITRGFRLKRRFRTSIDAMLVGKGAGRGKRAPKIKGNIIKLSLGGALVKLEEHGKLHQGDEITLSFCLPESKTNTLSVPTTTQKIKAIIASTNKEKKEAGVQFDMLSDANRKTLETVIRLAPQDSAT
jgi:CheY-like chemotaxis protein